MKDFIILIFAIIVTFGIMYLVQVIMPKYMKNDIRCFDVYLKK